MYQLQQFRLQPDWEIQWNEFTEYDIDLHGDRDLFELHEDLLQIHHKVENLTIDLGWYPSFDANGRYILLLVQNSNWELPLTKVESRSKKEIVDFIERWMTDRPDL